MESSTLKGFKPKYYGWDVMIYLYLRTNNPISYLCSLCRPPSFSANKPNYKSYNINSNGMNNYTLIARRRELANIHGFHLEPSKIINHDIVG
jgi:hypothetical protein